MKFKARAAAKKLRAEATSAVRLLAPQEHPGGKERLSAAEGMPDSDVSSDSDTEGKKADPDLHQSEPESDEPLDGEAPSDAEGEAADDFLADAE